MYYQFIMQLKVLNSNSEGNCYFMTPENRKTLILDFGLSFPQIRKSLDFNLLDVEAVLITHSHGDHSKGVREGLKAGLRFYMSDETAEELGIADHHNVHICHAKKVFDVGEFQIMPFEVKHDVKCFGYLINHPESGNTVFVTDTYYIPYKFPNLTNIIVEANYCQTIADENLLRDKKFLRDRVLQSHMEIQTTKQFLLANDLSQVNKILLIHLSDRNSHAESFKQQVELVTQKATFVASPGLCLSLDINPF